jgi:hypothetical protein
LPVGFEKKTASFFSITLGANAPGVIDYFARHSGESRNPVKRKNWTPAFAGVTSKWKRAF